MSIEATTSERPADPAATYFERTIDWRRRLDLYPEKLVITAQTWRTPYRMVIPLAQFDPDYSVYQIYPLRRTYRWLLLIAAGGFAAWFMYFVVGIDSPQIVVGVGIISAMLAVAFPKRVRVFQFTNWSTRYTIEFYESGPDKDSAQGFVDQVSECIRRLRVSTEPGKTSTAP
jgi:hypothetical protein